MQIRMNFLIDPEGWILPVLEIDGDVVDSSFPPLRAHQAKEIAERGLDPDDVRRQWRDWKEGKGQRDS